MKKIIWTILVFLVGAWFGKEIIATGKLEPTVKKTKETVMEVVEQCKDFLNGNTKKEPAGKIENEKQSYTYYIE